MSVAVPTKTQLDQAISQLRPDQLSQLWDFIKQLVQEPVAPLYQIHEYAIATGVRYLAVQHDHYLYGFRFSSSSHHVLSATSAAAG